MSSFFTPSNPSVSSHQHLVVTQGSICVICTICVICALWFDSFNVSRKKSLSPFTVSILFPIFAPDWLALWGWRVKKSVTAFPRGRLGQALIGQSQHRLRVGKPLNKERRFRRLSSSFKSRKFACPEDDATKRPLWVYYTLLYNTTCVG